MRTYFLAVVAGVLAAPLAAGAAVFYIDESSVVKSGDPIADNAYAFSEQVVLESGAAGDVVAAGETVSIKGRVGGDVLAGGGDVLLLGDVDGDVRVAGGNVTISGKVGGDVVVAGGEVRITDTASVGRDMVIAGGRIDVAGSVGGDVNMWAGRTSLSGRVGGDVSVRSGDPFSLTDSAVVAGNVEYRGPENHMQIASGAKVGGQISVIDEPVRRADAGTFTALVFGFAAMKAVALFLATLLLVFAIPRFSAVVVRHSQAWGKSFLIGFSALILLPLLGCLLLISAVGFLVGILSIALWGFVLIAGIAYAPVIIGAHIERWMAEGKKEHSISWKTGALGVLAFAVAVFVPVIGPLSVFIVCMMACGAVLSALYERIVA